MIDVKLEKFEGPLSLLIKMIEKEEMDITDVSLSKVADQFVEYIRRSSSIDPETLADFLVVAARLLLIKSKALLPYLFPEEEQEIDDFEKQLKMYKEFLEASKKIQTMIGKKHFMFGREFNRKAIMANMKYFSPPTGISANDLMEIFAEVIDRLKPMEILEERTIEKTVNIDEKISIIRKMIMGRMRFNFREVLEQAENKTEIIVSFLAMLELIKQREILVHQGDLFDDMHIDVYSESDADSEEQLRDDILEEAEEIINEVKKTVMEDDSMDDEDEDTVKVSIYADESEEDEDEFDDDEDFDDEEGGEEEDFGDDPSTDSTSSHPDVGQAGRGEE